MKMTARTCEASYAQQRIWKVTREDPRTVDYNLPTALYLRGPLDCDVLERAFCEIVRRHESLRTVFREVDGRVQQLLLPNLEIRLHRSVVPLNDSDNYIRLRAAAEANQPFSLPDGPLLRTELITIAADKHVLLMTVHHIVYDGWSAKALFSELSVLYNAYLRGETILLPPPCQYATYASQQNEWLRSAAAEGELHYWRERMVGVSPVLNLELTQPSRTNHSTGNTKYWFSVPDRFVKIMTEVARSQRVTPFMLMLAAFTVLLHRYTGEQDICVASWVAGRRKVEWESMIGLVRNAVFVRTIVIPEEPCACLLKRVRTSVTDAFEHQDLPFHEVMSSVGGAAASNWRERLIWFNGGGRYKPEMAGIDIIRLPTAPLWSGRYLSFSVFPLSDGPNTGQRWSGEVEYNTRLIDVSAIRVMVQHFENVMFHLCEEPRQTVGDLLERMSFRPWPKLG
jgi:hypothetical protein